MGPTTTCAIKSCMVVVPLVVGVLLFISAGAEARRESKVKGCNAWDENHAIALCYITAGVLWMWAGIMCCGAVQMRSEREKVLPV